MIFCACATGGLRRVGRVAWLSSCSRNAHDRNVLVRRAQSRINQATLETEMGNYNAARSGRPRSSLYLISQAMNLFGFTS